MDTDAKRDGDIIKVLRLLKQSGKFYVDQIIEAGGKSEHLVKLGYKEVDPDWAIRLAALYNHARTQGAGFLQAKMNHIMDIEEAAICLMIGPSYFDFLRGRVMKTDVSREGDSVLYDRDNGPGAYVNAISCKGCSRCAV